MPVLIARQRQQLRRPGALGAIAALAATAALAAGQQPTAGAAVTTVSAVTGRAFGYRSEVSLFGGPSSPRGPAGTTGCDAAASTACSPSATLPASGGTDAVTDTDGASGSYGPAVIFEAASLAVTAQGAAGEAGTVTTTATATGIGPGPFTAASAGSTCTATAAGASASTAIADGLLVTSTDPATGAPATTQAIDPAPAPGTTYTGTLDHLGDSFRAVFNEQITNPDGSITVNAVHLSLLGPIAVGDLIVGQAVCGVTSQELAAPPPGEAAAPAAEAAAPAAPAAAATAPPKGAASAAAPAAAAALPAQAADPTGPGAFGYVARVALFGGPSNTRPCADPPANTTDCRARPSVTLPAAGSATPVTDTVATADARFGPGIIFTSGPITVSTQGTAAASTSKVEIQNVNTSQQEVFTASAMSSTCNGPSGSTSITGGTLRTSEGTNLDSETDDTNTPVPANPPPNTTIEGRIETVGDSYRAVFNEQIVSNGAIVVNAFHMTLLGPTAVGELIVGQSRCGGTAVSTGTGTGTGGTGTGTGTGSGSGSGTSGTTAAGANRAGSGARTGAMATTGFGALGPLLLGVTLLLLGMASSLGGARLRARPARPARPARHAPDARP